MKVSCWQAYKDDSLNRDQSDLSSTIKNPTFAVDPNSREKDKSMNNLDTDIRSSENSDVYYNQFGHLIGQNL